MSCVTEDTAPVQVAAATNGFVSQNAAADSRRAERNRANARLSTGPRTLAGKLASSRNSMNHRLASGQLIIAGEDPTAFEDLLASLLNDHQPADETEKLLVHQLAQSYWLEQRAIRLQNTCFSESGVDEKGLALFLRYGVTYNRAFYKALAELSGLQKERRKVVRGFVSQNAQTAANSTVAPGLASQNSPQVAVRDEFVRQDEPSPNGEIGFVSQNAHGTPLEKGPTR